MVIVVFSSVGHIETSEVCVCVGLIRFPTWVFLLGLSLVVFVWDFLCSPAMLFYAGFLLTSRIDLVCFVLGNPLM